MNFTVILSHISYFEAEGAIRASIHACPAENAIDMLKGGTRHQFLHRQEHRTIIDAGSAAGTEIEADKNMQGRKAKRIA